MRMMLRFEIKKVFSKSKNQLAVLIMLVVLAVTSILAINWVYYVDENGDNSTGITAVKHLRDMRNEWAGYLTEDVLKEALEINTQINNSEEAQSEDIQEQNKAFAKKQGIADITDAISQAFSPYRGYDYYAVDRVSTEEIGNFYENRITALKEWLDRGEEYYTEEQKDFLIDCYEELETPFYYEYHDGWDTLLQQISTFILLLALIIGFLVSGIFSEEFQTRADSIFFSTKLGRTKGVLSKLGAGLAVITVFYGVFIFLYTFIVLLVLGADGAGCPIQFSMWRSAYNVTFFQAYLLIVAGGYVGTLFASLLAMLVSALTRSAAAAAITPFIVLCALPFVSRIVSLPQIFAFFPDQLLQVYLDLKDPGLVQFGENVTTVANVIIPVYLAASVVLIPAVYAVYKKVQVK